MIAMNRIYDASYKSRELLLTAAKETQIDENGEEDRGD